MHSITSQMELILLQMYDLRLKGSFSKDLYPGYQTTALPSTEDYLKTECDELSTLNSVLTCPAKKQYYQLILISVKKLLW